MGVNWYNPERKVQEGDLHPDLPEQEADDSHTVLEIAYDSNGDVVVGRIDEALVEDGERLLRLPVRRALGQRRRTHRAVDGHLLHRPGQHQRGLLPADGAERRHQAGHRGHRSRTDSTPTRTSVSTAVAGVDGQGVPGDDGDDDYSFEYGSDDYSKINGTEGNERLDTEDLNGNGYVDQDNSYWTLTLDLSDTTYLVQDNSELVPGNHWRKYRIPLADAESVNGMATWTSVKSARIWADGLAVGRVRS